MTTCRGLGGFDAWRYVMGGILQAAGISGFLGNLDSIAPKQPRAGSLPVARTRDHQPNGTGHPVRQLRREELARDDPDIAAAVDPTLRQGTELGFASRFGQFLKRMTDRVVQVSIKSVLTTVRLERLETRGNVGGVRYRFTEEHGR